MIVAEPSADPRQSVGRIGEAAAATRLEESGLALLQRRYRRRLGEIDLIALEGELVVFVEVKARRTARYGWPAESVTPAKRRRIARVALCFLAERGWLDRPSRFDVIEVYLEGSTVKRVRHIVDAFRP